MWQWQGEKKHCGVPSYIESLLYSLSYVGFYNHIKSNMLLSLQAGGCCIKKKLEKQHASHKRHAVWIYMCIHHGVVCTETQTKMFNDKRS